MLFLWYNMICACLSKPFWQSSPIYMCLLKCAQRKHRKGKKGQMLTTHVSTFAHFWPQTALLYPSIHPIELMCCHICANLYGTKIQIVILCTNWCWLVGTCSSLYICKWFVGFYFWLPCTLNWNFALGEIYQFKQSFQTIMNRRTRDVKKLLKAPKWPKRYVGTTPDNGDWMWYFLSVVWYEEPKSELFHSLEVEWMAEDWIVEVDPLGI